MAGLGRDRAVGRHPEPDVIGMDPAALVDEVLEGLAEVQLAQDRSDRRVVEVRLEVVEPERVVADQPVALGLSAGCCGRSLSGT